MGNRWLLQGSDCVWCLSQVRNIRKVLREIDKPFGLYPNFLSPVSGNWVQRKYRPCGFSHEFPFGLAEPKWALAESQGRPPVPGFSGLDLPAPAYLTPPRLLRICLSQLCTPLHDPRLAGMSHFWLSLRSDFGKGPVTSPSPFDLAFHLQL